MIMSGKKLVIYKVCRFLDTVIMGLTVFIAVFLLMGIAITFA